MKVDITTLPFDTERLIAICRQHGVTMIGLFGSYARGNQQSASDIDLLVRFGQPVSLLDMITLEQELSEALKRPVDLVTEAALHPTLKPAILHDLRVLYAAT